MMILPRDDRTANTVSTVVTIMAIVRTMVVVTIVKAVVVARLASGHERPVKVAPGHSIRIPTLDTEHDLDPVLGEDAGGAWSHTSCQDHGRPLLAQPHGINPTPVLGGSAELPLANRAALFVHCIQGKRLGTAEMLAELSLAQRNRNFHVIVSF
jgi:hypothetical protein